MKTIVYVDGFNLYYRALKKTKFKWLNLLDLCKNSLPSNLDIQEINFYTARVSNRINPSAPRDQQVYINALQSTGIINIHLGSFKIREKTAKLKEPLEFQPRARTCAISPNPKFVKIMAAEEKGSDVKLGVHLVRDGFQGKYEHAVVITNDVDLAEPLNIVKNELGIDVTLLKPCNKALDTLDRCATNLLYISADTLKKSQFPDQISSSIIKPSDW